MPNTPTSPSIAKTPKLRFPEFKDPWVEKKLGEILLEHKSRNVNNDAMEVFSVAKSKGVINQIEHLGRSYASLITTGYKIVYPDDIIYTKSPTSDFPFGIIKQNKLNRTGIVSTLYAVYKPQNKFIGSILDCYFSSWQHTYNYLYPIVQKGAKNTINISNDIFLDGAKLCLPTEKLEQTKIAEFLTAVDDKIIILDNQKKQLELYKKGLLQAMFPDSNTRGGGRSVRFLDIGGVSFPDWAEKRLGDVGENIIGLTYSPVNVKTDGSGVLVLRSSNVKNGLLNLIDQVKVNSNITDKLTIQNNDILICTRNGSQSLIGKCAIIKNPDVKMTFGAFMSVYRSEQNNFIFQLFSTNRYRDQINQNLGARINQITTANLNKFSFSFPTIPEQTKIAEFLTSIDDKIAVANDQITATKLWKKGLLQAMMV